MKQFLRFHLVPFCLAFSCFLAYLVYHPTPVEEDKGEPSWIIPNYDHSLRNEQFTAACLKSGEAIVCFGSSELSHVNFKAIPFNFFNNEKIYPFLALGHAGNQSLSILSQLASFRNSIGPQSKIVISLSPGWFSRDYREGTALEVFFKFQSDRMIKSFYYNDQIPDSIKEYLVSYIYKHYSSIQNPSEILMTMYLRKSKNENLSVIHDIPFWINMKIIELSEYIFNWFSALREIHSLERMQPDQFSKVFPYAPTLKESNWDSLKKTSLIEFDSVSRSNTLGITDKYFLEYIKDNNKRGELVFPVDAQTTEIRDFLMLMAFLKSTGCRPLTIIGPFNPWYYKGVEGFMPVKDSLNAILRSYSFQAFDFYSKDTNTYVKGELDDVMHTGEYGWFRIDSAIYSYFNIKNAAERKKILD